MNLFLTSMQILAYVMLTDGLEVWIIVMFLSDSHSDGTHSLLRIHW